MSVVYRFVSSAVYAIQLMNRRRALINSVCDFYVQIVILDLDFDSIKYSILSTFAVKKKKEK